MLFNFQDAEGDSDIKPEQNSEEEDITIVDIVPCEVTSLQLLCEIVAVIMEFFKLIISLGQKSRYIVCNIARHVKTNV